jgi:hypothetical protein
MERKIKHLEILQATITRMASNSFLIKGWCITLVAAILALASQGSNQNIIFVSYLPIIMFWTLDAYFLRQERLFRKLYDKIRIADEYSIDFSMNTAEFAKETASWIRVAFSQTLLLFYGIVFLLVVVITIII